MTSPSKSNDKLYRQLGNHENPYPTGVFGVEVELEGSLYGSGKSHNYWHVKQEGSLRGGMEYVFRNPLSREELPIALKEFDHLMKKSVPHASIRCSTHIHVSILDYTTAQIYNAMLAWYFVENLFVRTQSNNRQGNLFSLRLSDAEEIALSIKDSLNYADGWHTFHVERNRYAALNLCAITKFGSFEFRFLDAMTMGSDIERWCIILHSLMENTKNISPKNLLDMYEQKTALEFLGTLIGSQYVPFIVHGMSPSEVTRQLHTNYDHIFEIGSLIGKRKYELPRGMWDDDLDNERSKYGAGWASAGLNLTAAELDSITAQLSPTPQASTGFAPGQIFFADEALHTPAPPEPVEQPWHQLDDPDDIDETDFD